MAKIRLTIEFQNDGGRTSRYEKEITTRERSTKEGIEQFAQRTFVELEKDLMHGRALDDLPDPRGLHKVGKHRFPMEKVFSNAYFDEMNSQNVWLEVQNGLHEVRFLLANAKAYKDLEPPHQDDFDVNGLLYIIHFEKMARFDLAAFRLAKAEDLVARLVFEGTGGELLPMERINWESQLTWDQVRNRIKDRASIARLSSMDDAEYERFLQLMRGFKNPNFVQTFLDYRDRVAHRITPSVDYPELYTTLEDRAWEEIRDSTGRVVGRKKGFHGLKRNADFQFKDLYQAATETFRHYLVSLRQLRGISILDPPLLPID